MQVSEHLWKAAQNEVKCEMIKRPLLSYWFMAHIVRCVRDLAANPPKQIRAPC